VAKPALWSLDAPSLYRVHSVVVEGSRTVDACDTPFGIRSIRYDVDGGFFLNDQHIKMHGMCVHEDGGSVGAAVPEAVWARRLGLLKAMGCNAIRTSHNPPTPEFLDLCDRLGMLVMDESFDEWTHPKVPHGYAQYFADWSQRDLTDMLHRDRNHPCIVLWSVGNEIGEQTADNGLAILQPLVDTAHREDPTRPVTAACDNVYTDHGGAKLDFLAALDIVGYNYVDRWGTRRETYYADDRQQFPTRKFVGTEDSNVYGVRGEYHFVPLGRDKLVRADWESAMINAEQLVKFDMTHDYVIGEFFWTGIDYLGESRWPRKLATSGCLDTCGFPKDNYYFFQSRWTAKPMLHLLPHWNWAGREGQVIPVICYTNCTTVELFLNGRSLGAKSLEFPRPGTAGGWNTYAEPPVLPTTADLHLSWDVPYEAGVLKAVGYQGGAPVCEQEIHTAGAPAAVVLSADKTTVDADGRDAVQLTAEIVDAAGNVVPDADNAVTFAVAGPGALIGVDNGDPASHDDYKARVRPAFHGLCLAIVQSTFAAGSITVTATAEGLQPATVTVTSGVPAVAVPRLP
jgi:beta-galactosidase